MDRRVRGLSPAPQASPAVAMAVFIPEWHKATGRELQIKRVLNTLDDAYVLRRPVRAGECPADLFVQHADDGWLALAIEATPFAELDPAQLFSSETRTQFEQRLERLQRIPDRPGHAGRGFAALVLLWNCSIDETRALTREYLGRFGTRLVSREQFSQLGAKLVAGLLTPVASDIEQELLGQYFPEAEIAPACTTRRLFRRDNSARLARFFLDREQEWAAKLDLELPAEQAAAAGDFSVRLINGVAGSGKTLIAIHRALLLAELFPRQRILTLIHNTPIVADLKARLHDARGGLPPNVEIQTFFAWVHAQWRRAFRGRPRMPQDPATLTELVRHHRTRWPGLRQSDGQLQSELDFINEGLFVDEAAYVAASRTGRGFALRPAERSQVWAMHEAVTRTLHGQGLRMWSALPREICLAGHAHAALQRYEHILVDEAQFFAPSWFHVVKMSLASRGQLFMCADPNQGFMKSRLSWKSLGLEVSGRTKRLRRSYRTTRAILESATNLLSLLGCSPDDDYLLPEYRDMEAGAKPLLVYTASPQDSIDRVAAELSALTDGSQIPLGAFLVIYGDKVHKQGLHARLARQFGAGSVWWFNERDQKKEPPQGYGHDYLRMAYLDTATGLEASVVFLIGIEDLFFTGAVPGLDDEEMAALREENARKLYMAMTRAGQRLVVLASQRLVPALEALFDEPSSSSATTSGDRGTASNGEPVR